jgi:thiol-disulfide isomerase/thioredoxin
MKKMNKKIILIAGIIALFLITACNTEANITGESTQIPNTEQDFDNEKVIVYFFWGDGCPYCSQQKPHMEELAGKYPGIEVLEYEIYYDTDNRNLFQEAARLHGTTARGVPMTFIGDKYWSGFHERMVPEMEAQIKKCLEEECEDPIRKGN